MSLLDLFTEFDDALDWAVENDPLLADDLPCAVDLVGVVRSPQTAVAG